MSIHTAFNATVESLGVPSPLHKNLSEAIVATNRVLANRGQEHFAAIAESSATVLELGGRAFRASIVRGAADTVLVVGGEYGIGLANSAAMARALCIREMLAPDATVVTLPNSTTGEPNLNFSREERARLRRGHAAPLVDRLCKAVDTVTDGEQGVHVYGPSQGAMLASHYAAQPDVAITSLTLVEAPNATNRGYATLVYDFLASGTHLNHAIRLNKEASPTSSLPEEIIARQSREFPKWALGLALPDSLAIMGLLRHATFSRNLHNAYQAHPKLPIVYAHSQNSRVSRADTGQDYTQTIQQHGGEVFRFTGPMADHSITNTYALNAALLARAAA